MRVEGRPVREEGTQGNIGVNFLGFPFASLSYTRSRKPNDLEMWTGTGEARPSKTLLSKTPENQKKAHTSRRKQQNCPCLQ